MMKQGWYHASGDATANEAHMGAGFRPVIKKCLSPGRLRHRIHSFRHSSPALPLDTLLESGRTLQPAMESNQILTMSQVRPRQHG
jgi:hypothetical protein